MNPWKNKAKADVVNCCRPHELIVEINDPRLIGATAPAPGFLAIEDQFGHRFTARVQAVARGPECNMPLNNPNHLSFVYFNPPFDSDLEVMLVLGARDQVAVHLDYTIPERRCFERAPAGGPKRHFDWNALLNHSETCRVQDDIMRTTVEIYQTANR